MAKKRSSLRILLIQIREDARVRKEELDSFADYSGLSASQFTVLNVFDTPDFSPDVVDGYDAVLVGGASEASVVDPKTYPFLIPSQKVLLRCIDSEIPTFASCFGFQLVVVALEGTIIHTPQSFEMGTVPILLTDAAKSDPLFHDSPNGFMAVSVHQYKATEAPSGCETLAYTDHCCHSFRVTGKPFWAFQFHPEVDRSRLVERLTIYKDHYTGGDDHLDEVLKRAEETPESNILVRKFVDRILLGKLTHLT